LWINRILLYFFFASPILASSLDLKSLYDKAIQNSISHKESLASMQIASNKKLVSASKFYPKVSVYYELLKINEFPVTEDSVITEYRRDRRDRNIRVEQILFDRNVFTEFFKSSDTKTFKILELEDSNSKLMLEIIEKYFSLLSAIDKLGLLKKELDSYKYILDKAKIKERSGLISRVDLLEAISEKNLVIAKIIDANSQIDAKTLELEGVAGLNIDSIIPIKKDVTIALLRNEIDYFLSRVDKNIDMKRYLLEAKNKHKELISYNMMYVPKVSAYYDYTDYDTPQKDPNRRIGVKFELNIFNGFGDYFAREIVSVENKVLHYKLIEKRRSLKAEVKNYYLLSKNSLNSLNAYTNVWKSKELFLEATNLSFDLGRRNIIDVLEANTEYYDILDKMTEFKYQHILNYSKLLYSVSLLNLRSFSDINLLLDRNFYN
jgi:outer membrane protein